MSKKSCCFFEAFAVEVLGGSALEIFAKCASDMFVGAIAYLRHGLSGELGVEVAFDFCEEDVQPSGEGVGDVCGRWC